MEEKKMELARKKKLWFIIGGLVIFFAILSVAGVEMTSQPSFCKSCHSMEVGAYKTWQQSTHKEIDCMKCHKDSGIIGLAKAKIGGLKQLWVTATGTTPDKIVAEVPSERCLKCHENIPDDKNIKVSKLAELNKKINYDHQMHLDKVKECTACHARVVHGEKAPTKSDVKSQCLNCHQQKNVVINTCTTCHKAEHQEKYFALHSKDVAKGTQKCMECHADSVWKEGLVGVGPNFCAECHKVEMPHKPAFVKLHGAEYEKNKEACNKCHNAEAVKAGSKAKTCIACHKVEMPHVKGFKDNHLAEFKKNPAACVSCHNITKEKAGSKAKACVTCHSKQDIHPTNWKSIHGKESKKPNVTCTNCHSSNSVLGFKTVACSSCHSKLNVHSSTWQGRHYAESKKASATCTNCHSTKGQSLGFNAKTCYQCHNKGHQSGFIKVHESKFKQKVINCSNCHKKGGIANQCTSCHKVAMPHPTTWNKTHGATAKVNSTACTYCHSAKNPVNPKASYAKPGYCTTCHAQGGGHPSNWVQIHNVQAAKTNGSACATCHVVKKSGNPKAGWCYQCHQSSYKHTDGWTMPDQHGNAYLTKGYAACNVCHVRENDCVMCHGPKW